MSASPRRRAVGASANREYRAEWIERPGNRERARAAQARYRAKPDVKARRAAGRRERNRLAMEVLNHVVGPRTGECRVCGNEFDLNPVGRPRVYCNGCVDEFQRSDRRCPKCGRIIEMWRRRMTCRSCGALWFRGRVPA